MRTIFDSHPGGGVAAVAISRDARYLVTISAGRAQVRKTLPPLGLCGYLGGSSRGWGAESGSAWVLLDFIKLNTVELRSRSEYGIKAPNVLSLKQFLAVLTEIELSGYAVFILLQSFISPPSSEAGGWGLPGTLRKPQTSPGFPPCDRKFVSGGGRLPPRALCAAQS